MNQPVNLDQLSEQQVRKLAGQLRSENQRIQLQNEQYKHEIAILRRHRFARKSEVLNAHQRSLLDDLVEEDLAGVEEKIERLLPTPQSAESKQQPKRQPLPPELPQAPVPAQVIDKGIPAAGLLAQVLVAKYGDHLPLYRQEKIFARAGVEIARSTLADWVGRCGVALQPLVDELRAALHQQDVLHADETPVAMLKPGKQKTHRAYVWAYTSTPFSALNTVIYDFAPSRSGEHARAFLQSWRGKLVCDDFSGYKASFKEGITEIGCMAHARRKFYDLHVANQSQLAQYALEQIGKLYEIERQAKDLSDKGRHQLRQTQSKPILDQWYQWLISQRQKVPDGSATAKAIDYSLKRWKALIHYAEDGAIPIDNNRVENQIRPWALGPSNWLFAGSLRSGQRAANVMSLIQSAKLNGHDPYAYLKDVLTRLPTQRANQINELLPQYWQPTVNR